MMNETTFMKMSVVSAVVIPHNESKNLEAHSVPRNEQPEALSETIKRLIDDSFYLETPLCRPLADGTPGLYVYHNNPINRDGRENVRATRLAMACGLFSHRFWGDALIVRSSGGRWEDVIVDDILYASTISFDLRTCMHLPNWLLDAAHQNYQDGAALQAFTVVMSRSAVDSDDTDGESDTTSSIDGNHEIEPDAFVAKSTLCLHCRGPASTLCDCEGAYFCSPPARCQEFAWPHRCQCKTWKAYTERRQTLSSFEGLGAWQKGLILPEFWISEIPYQQFLADLGIDQSCPSWWRTEIGGWSGGQGASASAVDAFVRLSYEEGFAPLPKEFLPPQRRSSVEEIEHADLINRHNSLGLMQLESWEDYYKLRNIPHSSPVALLCTFPLTVYHAICRFAEVPATVSKMLRRPLRIHIVGAEKELNFLDLFQEVGFLLPEAFQVELIFVVREDMLPATCSSRESRFHLKERLGNNLTIGAVSGTYAESLDPNFDVGSGQPDIIMALNAGLFAYPSWRSVVTYLHDHPNVLGVFTDYNEYSGVNCAGLGGAICREGLEVNPFRQPRAMPVYSMNLPQFSNSFFYVFNEQKLDS